MQPWNLAFLAGLIVYVSIRGFYKQRMKVNRHVVRRVGGVEYALQGILLPGVLLLPLVYLFTSWLAFADCRLPAVAPFCGGLLMVGALALFGDRTQIWDRIGPKHWRCVTAIS